MNTSKKILITLSGNPIDPNDCQYLQKKPNLSIQQYFMQVRHLIPPSLPVIAFLNQKPILRTQWTLTCLKENDNLTFSSVPQREVVASALTLFAVAASGPIGIGIGAGLFGAGTLGATLTATAFSTAFVGIIGTAAWSSVAPSQSLGLSPRSPSYSLSSQANNIRNGQPVPVIYGTHRIVPDLISAPYSRFENKGKQVLYQLFAVGHGEFDVSKATIGSSNLTLAEHGFSSDTSIKKPKATLPVVNGLWHVISGNVSNFTLEQELGFSDPVQIGSPSFPIKTIEVDISLPQGLYANSPADRTNATLNIHIQYRVLGTASWSNIPNTFSSSGGSQDTTYPPQISFTNNEISFQTSSAHPIRYSFAWNVTNPGTYEVRVKRVTAPSSNLFSRVIWTGLKGFLHSPPRSYPISTFPLKLVANASTTGASARTIALHVTRKIRSYDPVTKWSKPKPSQSIPFAIADMLTNSTYGANIQDQYIDLDALHKLDASLPSHHTFNAVFDQSLTLWDALRRTARCARTSIYIQGGKIRFSRDGEISTPVTLFSTHNIVKNSFSLHHRLDSQDTPDKVIIEYINPVSWLSETVSAQAEHNFQPINTLRLPLFGCTNSQHAQDEAQFILTSSQNKRRVIQFDTELDGLLPVFGDTIAVSHPLPSWGTSGFITAFEPENNSLSLSQAINSNGYIVIRSPNGNIIGPFSVSPSSKEKNNNIVTISDAQLDTQPIIKALQYPQSTPFAFGESNHSWAAKAKIISIRPKSRHIVSIEALVEQIND
jgi:hypothetical protein